MFNNKIKNLLLLLPVLLWAVSCVEPIELDIEDNFDNMLVVEGTVTNELMRHKVKLTRTYPLEEAQASAESNARVSVVENGSREFLFQEEEPGMYVSLEEFKAEAASSYVLRIVSAAGKTYESSPSTLVPSAPVAAIEPVLVNNDNGSTGVALVLEGTQNQGEASYYRYEYEETFKIVSPFKKNYDFEIQGDTIIAVFKTREEYTCFRTENSQEIVIANTGFLSEDKVNGLMVNFVEKGDPRMSHRYSILVRQYGLTAEAYRFYETLKNLSESESLFSQIQPGHIPGNVHSLDDPSENVLGFFSVSEVSSKRAFFSFTDFFDENDRERPHFIAPCEPVKHPLPLTIQFLREGSVKYYSHDPLEGNFVIRSPCVDCTLSGTNVVPDFWEE